MEQQKVIKGYSWNPEDKIEITGREFDSIVKLSQLFKLLNKQTEEIINRMKENGLAKPIYEDDDLNKTK